MAPIGKTLKFYMNVDISLCISFINWFGYSKEPSHERLLLNVQNKAFKHALHYGDLIILAKTLLHPYTAVICEGCVLKLAHTSTDIDAHRTAHLFAKHVCLCIY